MFNWIQKIFNPRGPNKFEPQTRADGTQYPAPKGETPYGTYQNPHKKKEK